MSLADPAPPPTWFALSPKGHENWLRIALYRLISAILLPVVILVIPGLGALRMQALVTIAPVAILGNIALYVKAKRGGTMGPITAAIDVALAVIFIAFVPNAFAAAVILTIGVAPLYVFWLGARSTTIIVACAGVLFAVIGVYHQPDYWYIAVTMYVIVVTVVIAVTSRIASAVSAANRRYDGLVNGIEAVVWEADGLVGDPDFISNQIDKVMGLSFDDCNVSGYYRSRIHPEDLHLYDESREAIASGLSSEVDYRILDAEGKTRFLHERVNVSTRSDGSASRRGIVVDDTARHLAEVSARSYDDFIAGVPMAMAILRLDDLDDPESLRIVTANPAAVSLFEGQTLSPIGQRIGQVVPNIPKFTVQLANVVILRSSLEAPYISLPNSQAVYSIRAIPLPDRCVGISLDDVTKAARATETLKHQALHDHLTGLPNRAHFNERLQTAIRASISPTDPTSVAVLMIDLNRFKFVNDNYGHETGDRLLAELAKRLGRNIRGCDTIARLGGDEFAVLLRSRDPERTAVDIAERISQLVSEPFQIGVHTMNVGASIGIAVGSRALLSARTLVRDADQAMYRAKAAGGGIFVYDGEERSEIDRSVSVPDPSQVGTSSVR